MITGCGNELHVTGHGTSSDGASADGPSRCVSARSRTSRDRAPTGANLFYQPVTSGLDTGITHPVLSCIKFIGDDLSRLLLE